MTAARTVLGTGELFENIIACLAPDEILRCKRVCRDFKARIEQFLPLQRAAFLQPQRQHTYVEYTRDGPEYGQSPVKNLCFITTEQPLAKVPWKRLKRRIELLTINTAIVKLRSRQVSRQDGPFDASHFIYKQLGSSIFGTLVKFYNKNNPLPQSYRNMYITQPPVRSLWVCANLKKEWQYGRYRGRREITAEGGVTVQHLLEYTESIANIKRVNCITIDINDSAEWRDEIREGLQHIDKGEIEEVG